MERPTRRRPAVRLPLSPHGAKDRRWDFGLPRPLRWNGGTRLTGGGRPEALRKHAQPARPMAEAGPPVRREVQARRWCEGEPDPEAEDNHS